jgi:hypothetical protein
MSAACVYGYSPSAEDELRALVLNCSADYGDRAWAVTVLRSWRVELDPHIFPFVAGLQRDVEGMAMPLAKGAHA